MPITYLYVVLSQTGSFPSRVLHLFTQDEFNHVSLSPEPFLEEMYSFGRLRPSRPFPGGFVRESRSGNTFSKFHNVKIAVLALPLTDEQFADAVTFLRNMYDQKTIYRYNYLGVIAGLIRVRVRLRNRFFCSEFVKAVLDRYGVTYERPPHRVIHPMDFFALSGAQLVYRGPLRDYLPRVATQAVEQNLV